MISLLTDLRGNLSGTSAGCSVVGDRLSNDFIIECVGAGN